MRRAYERLLKEYLRLFPCVGIVGPRQCGKTTLLSTLPRVWDHFDLERTSDHELIARDPELFLRLHPGQVSVDEAQLLPALFPALRVAIDSQRAERGRFVVTGSSSPELLRSLSESLAGRIGIIEMAPLSFAEAFASKTRRPTLGELLASRSADAATIAEKLRHRTDVKQVHEYWFRGGYPEPWLRRGQRFRELWMEQYVQTYLFRDIGRLFPRLDENRFRSFLQLLAGLSGTVINSAEVARALGVSQPTARDYFDIAHGTFLWRRVPSFERDGTKRLVKHAKGYLRDTGLLHHLLRLPDLRALLSHPKMGASWEGLVIEEIIRQLICAGASFDYHFYRTAAGAEVDLVLDGSFGLVPIEIKYSQASDGRALRSLSEFVTERGCPVGIVINNDVAPRLINERIVAVPFACL